jgi:hypothetical protein
MAEIFCNFCPSLLVGMVRSLGLVNVEAFLQTKPYLYSSIRASSRYFFRKSEDGKGMALMYQTGQKTGNIIAMELIV